MEPTEFSIFWWETFYLRLFTAHSEAHEFPDVCILESLLGERGVHGWEEGWEGEVGGVSLKENVFFSLRSARRVQSTWWRSTRDSDREITLVGQLPWQHNFSWKV